MNFRQCFLEKFGGCKFFEHRKENAVFLADVILQKCAELCKLLVQRCVGGSFEQEDPLFHGAVLGD